MKKLAILTASLFSMLCASAVYGEGPGPCGGLPNFAASTSSYPGIANTYAVSAVEPVTVDINITNYAAFINAALTSQALPDMNGNTEFSTPACASLSNSQTGFYDTNITYNTGNALPVRLGVSGMPWTGDSDYAELINSSDSSSTLGVEITKYCPCGNYHAPNCSNPFNSQGTSLPLLQTGPGIYVSDNPDAPSGNQVGACTAEVPTTGGLFFKLHALPGVIPSVGSYTTPTNALELEMQANQ